MPVGNKERHHSELVLGVSIVSRSVVTLWTNSVRSTTIPTSLMASF
jgi:hypothetical protein